MSYEYNTRFFHLILLTTHKTRIPFNDLCLPRFFVFRTDLWAQITAEVLQQWYNYFPSCENSGMCFSRMLRSETVYRSCLQGSNSVCFILEDETDSLSVMLVSLCWFQHNATGYRRISSVINCPCQLQRDEHSSVQSV